MTLSLPKLRSLGAILVALVWTSLTFGAALTPTGVEARSSTVYYSAELAAPAAQARTIIGGVVWECAGTNCLAAKASTRPMKMCKRVVRELGEVTSFIADGKALEADDLASCNAK